jgi:acetyl-CoA carboxylase biotin carboxylase subunit
MRPITKVLVANRGEIAVRIQRTLREMGIASVAVFSDADAGSPAVRAADEAVRIGPAPSAESYLRIDRLVDAARETGADAVHPGFGFLAENAAFAEACDAANLIFIGPPAKVIRALGSKQEAKRIASAAGVPVVPGYAGADQSLATLVDEAQKVGLPVLIKASAGGGGKGMRIVRDPAELASAVEAARREAASAFGDDTLLIEKYIERPRHVEIQILGDRYGKLVHLFERECSIQRRHQKIIEETPSPALDPELRRRMGDAGVAVGRAAGYENAGTVEFILAPDASFYFLEVNTRLQVEHPITELVTGIDIVREQLRIARGEPLGFGQEDVRQSGAAIECRLYAEDPDSGFLPQTGRIVDFHVPELQGLRVDSGVESGSVVGIHYDPMLAKLAVHAPDRPQAIALMRRVLDLASVQGVTTNQAFLGRVLAHPEFGRGRTHTHFLQEHLAEPLAPAPPELEQSAAIAATLAAHEARRATRALLPALEPGFRNNPYSRQTVAYRIDQHELRVEYENRGQGRFALRAGAVDWEVTLVGIDGPELVWESRGRVRRARVVRDAERHYVHTPHGSLTLFEEPRFPEREQALAPGACVAPMPGKVVKIVVSTGEVVSAGQVLLILEAMKMEHSVRAPSAGVIGELRVAAGDQVEEGAVLAVVSEESEA